MEVIWTIKDNLLLHLTADFHNYHVRYPIKRSKYCVVGAENLIFFTFCRTDVGYVFHKYNYLKSNLCPRQTLSRKGQNIDFPLLGKYCQ